MTKEEAMQTTDDKMLFEAMKADPALLQDSEVRSHFNKITYENFVASIEKSGQKYDPDIHYDFRKKGPVNTFQTPFAPHLSGAFLMPRFPLRRP